MNGIVMVLLTCFFATSGCIISNWGVRISTEMWGRGENDKCTFFSAHKQHGITLLALSFFNPPLVVIYRARSLPKWTNVGRDPYTTSVQGIPKLALWACVPGQPHQTTPYQCKNGRDGLFKKSTAIRLELGGLETDVRSECGKPRLPQNMGERYCLPQVHCRKK